VNGIMAGRGRERAGRDRYRGWQVAGSWLSASRIMADSERDYGWQRAEQKADREPEQEAGSSMRVGSRQEFGQGWKETKTRADR
jgi:hypothetical protein